MTQVNRMGSGETSLLTSTLPRRTPGASGHKPAGLAQRPPLPRRTIPLSARPLPRELADQGWPAIPTAGPAPVPAYDDAWGRPSAWAAFGDSAA